MYREVSKLILYRDLGEDSILLNMADIFKRFDSCHYRADELITDIYREMKALLDLATTYGFDKNLWHNYLTFVLVTNENSFSMTSEKVGANNVKRLVLMTEVSTYLPEMILRCFTIFSIMISDRLRRH